MEVQETAILKPEPYDSLVPLRTQQKPFNYYQYVGQKLFLLPKSHKYTKSTSEVVGEYSLMDYSTYIQLYIKNKEEIAKQKTNVYKPLFVSPKTQWSDGAAVSKHEEVESKYYTIIDIIDYYKKSKLKECCSTGLHLEFTLKNDGNGDTLYWHIDANYLDDENIPFMTAAYYEKQKYCFKDKTFIADRDMQNLVELSTGKNISANKNSEWKCTEVSLLELESFKFFQPYYILKDNNGNEIKIKLGNKDGFITKEEFIERERLKKLKQEELIAEQKKREQERIDNEKKENERQAIFKSNCINQYGEKYGEPISQGKVLLGMTTEMCKLAWGEALEVNGTVVNGLRHEQWVYSWKHYLYFDNGILTGYQY